MRLIDVDAFCKRFNNMVKTELDKMIACNVMIAITSEPTAYDVEKVVKELKKRIVIEPLDCADAEWNNALYKAIEIVKAGVRNDSRTDGN